MNSHINSELNDQDLWFVVSAGGWLSASVYYRPGPGGTSQVYKTGEPRCAEVPLEEVLDSVAARLTKGGAARFGQMIAAFGGQETPEAHQRAQIWIELGMALKQQQQHDQAQACLWVAAVVGSPTRWLQEQLAPERPHDLPAVWSAFDIDKLTPPTRQQARKIFNYYLQQAQIEGLAEAVMQLTAAQVYDLISLPGLIRSAKLNNFWNCLRNTSQDQYVISEIANYRAHKG